MEKGALSSSEEASQISPDTTLADALAMLQLKHAHVIHEADPDIKVPCCASLSLDASALLSMYARVASTVKGLTCARPLNPLADFTRCCDIFARCLDVQVIIAWGSGIIVICFRGTASMKNVVHDLQACRTASCQLPSHIC